MSVCDIVGIGNSWKIWHASGGMKGGELEGGGQVAEATSIKYLHGRPLLYGLAPVLKGAG